jgi:parallel beta-helix repeat protein
MSIFVRFFVFIAISLSGSAFAAQRVALVIGNSEYEHTTTLVNPQNDAADFGKKLQELGFTVITKLNTNKSDLELALKDFRREANGSEIAMVFYAGHGIAVDGVTRIVPVDAKLSAAGDVDFETVPLPLIERALDGSTGLRLVILDACRDNPFVGQMAASGGGKRSISRGLAAVEPNRADTMIWYAAKDGATAADGDGRNSPFTKALLDNIETPGLEVGRMFRKVNEEVYKTTGEQEPFVYGSLGNTDHYFLPPTAAPVVPAPTKDTAVNVAGAGAVGGDIARTAYEYARQINSADALDLVALEFPDTIWARLAIIEANKMRGAAKPTVVPSLGTIVDASGGGDFRSVQKAIEAAKADDTILVRPGTYEEKLVVSKPLNIVGDGPREAIIVKNGESNVLLWTAPSGKVSGLTLLQTGGGEAFGIDIDGGSLLLENNDISSQSYASVGIRNGAAPTLRKNIIHDGAQSGIFVYDGGGGLIEDNEIFGNTYANIQIKGGSDPVVRGNRIYNGKEGGIFINEQGKGRIENNDIYGNTLANVQIKDEADPVVTGNRIYQSKESGIFINEKGKGLIENNDIYENGLAGIQVRDAGTPMIIGNKIHDGQQGGVLFNENGLGTFQGNEVYGNTYSGVEIASGADPQVIGNQIHSGKESGVFVNAGGRGKVSDNDIFSNAYSGVEITGESSNPVISGNRVSKHPWHGVYVHQAGKGEIRENDLTGNDKGAFLIAEDAGKVVRKGNKE